VCNPLSWLQLLVLETSIPFTVVDVHANQQRVVLHRRIERVQPWDWRGCVCRIRDAGDNGCPDGSYEQSAGAGDSGYWMDDGSNGHDYFKDQTAPPASAFDYTSGAELIIDSANYDNVEDRTDGVVIQSKIVTDATRGAQSAETMYVSYDEI